MLLNNSQRLCSLCPCTFINFRIPFEKYFLKYSIFRKLLINDDIKGLQSDKGSKKIIKKVDARNAKYLKARTKLIYPKKIFR